MALLERLAIVVQADAQGAIKELNAVGKAAERDLGKAEKHAKNWGATLQKTGVGMVGAATVMGGALISAAHASEEANKSTLKLENTIKNMPKLAGASADEFQKLATAIQNKTAADGDAIVEGQALLGTFSTTAEEIKGLTPLVVDYARKFGVDIPQAAMAVGKAMDGQIGALKRNGVSIDEALYKTDRYAAVTKALREQVGGFAEAEGKTFSGQMERLKNQLGDVQEGIGVGVVGALNDVIGPLSTVGAKFASLDEDTQSTIGKFLTIGTAATGAIGGLSLLAGTVANMRGRFYDVTQTADGTTRSLNNFGKAAKGIGAAGIVVATVAALAEATDYLGSELDGLLRGSTSVPKMGTALTELGQEGRAAGELTKQFGDDLGGLSDKVKELDSAGVRLNGTLSKFGVGVVSKPITEAFSGVSDAKKDIDAIDKALADMASSGGAPLAAAAFERLTKGMDPATVKAFKSQLNDWSGAKDGAKFTGELAERAGELTEEMEAGGAVLKEYKDQQGRVADALKERLDREKALTDQINELYEASMSLIDAEYAREQSLDAINDGTHAANQAQQEYNDAVKEHGKDSAEALTAQDRLADSMRDLKGDYLNAAGAAMRLAEDQAKARGETVMSEEKQRIYRTELEKFASTLAPGSPLRSQLEQYVGLLSSTPSTVKTQMLVEWIDSHGFVKTGPTSRFNATGGRLGAYEPSWVGEGGRAEIFVPDQPGRVLSNREAMKALSGAGGTVNNNITVVNPVAERASDSIARELRWQSYLLSVS